MNTHAPEKSPSLGKAVSTAVIIMAGSNVLSRVLGFARIKALAMIGGTTGQMDAYVYAFLLPDLLNHLLAASALSITFIPIFQKLLQEQDEKAAWKFFSNILTVGTLFFIVFIGISMVFTDFFLSFSGKNINNPDNPGQYALVVKLTRIILPAQLFFFWGSLLDGAQYAKKQFIFPALNPILYNVGIIAGGLLLSGRLGMEGFSWGVLAGAFIGNVGVQLPAALKIGLRYRWHINFRDPGFIRYVVLTLPFIIGFSLQFSNEVLIKIFGSYCSDGVGAIASLDYSYKIMYLFVGIFAQSFAAGFYPFLSQLAVEKKFGEMNALLQTTITRIAVLLIPVSGIMIVLAREVIAVLLQGGKFGESSTSVTAVVYMWYLPGTFFAGVIQIFSRAFYALQKTVLPLVLITAVLIVLLPVYWIFTNTFGAPGIAATATGMMLLLFIVFVIAWKRETAAFAVQKLLADLTRITLVTAAGMGICWLMKNSVRHTFFASDILQSITMLLIAGMPAVVATGVCFELMGLLHIRGIGATVMRRLKR